MQQMLFSIMTMGAALASACAMASEADTLATQGIAHRKEAPSIVGSADERAWRDIPDLKLEGYIQAQLDMLYYEAEIVVRVRGFEVFVYNVPNNKLIEESISSFISDMPRVKKVTIVKGKSKRADAIPGYESLSVMGRSHGSGFRRTQLYFRPLFPSTPSDLFAWDALWRQGDGYTLSCCLFW